jgi:hypothetical protein
MISHAEALLRHDMGTAAAEIEAVLTDLTIPVLELVRGGGGEAQATQRIRRAFADRDLRRTEPQTQRDRRWAMSTSIQIVCSTCGSQNVRRDAYAEWDTASQRWQLAAVFDQGYCEECGGESSLKEVLIATWANDGEGTSC